MGRGKPSFIVAADFHSVNTPRVANFKAKCDAVELRVGKRDAAVHHCTVVLLYGYNSHKELQKQS